MHKAERPAVQMCESLAWHSRLPKGLSGWCAAQRLRCRRYACTNPAANSPPTKSACLSTHWSREGGQREQGQVTRETCTCGERAGSAWRAECLGESPVVLVAGRAKCRKEQAEALGGRHIQAVHLTPSLCTPSPVSASALRLLL